MTKNATTVRVLGCDVAKDTVFIFDTSTGVTKEVNNTVKALSAVLQRLESQAFVVCEATGGHEMALLSAAGVAGLPAHRGDPRKISAFLRSLRSHGKTDPIDAAGLARYGLERHDQLTLWQPTTKTQDHLQRLVRLRSDLVNDRADYKRRLKAPGEGPDKRHIAATIKNFNQRIEAIEADIHKLLKTDDHLANVVKHIEAIKGCGETTAIMLAGTMPELGQLTRRQAASLAGLAPHPYKSGKMDAYRHVRGGRREVKTALFMAALTARRHNPQLRDFANRLAGEGKKPIVVVTAVARKLITIINAKLRDALYDPVQQLS